MWPPEFHNQMEMDSTLLKRFIKDPKLLQLNINHTWYTGWPGWCCEAVVFMASEFKKVPPPIRNKGIVPAGAASVVDLGVPAAHAVQVLPALESQVV